MCRFIWFNTYNTVPLCGELPFTICCSGYQGFDYFDSLVIWCALDSDPSAELRKSWRTGSPRTYTNWHRNMDDLLSQISPSIASKAEGSTISVGVLQLHLGDKRSRLALHGSMMLHGWCTFKDPKTSSKTMAVMWCMSFFGNQWPGNRRIVQEKYVTWVTWSIAELWGLIGALRFSSFAVGKWDAARGFRNSTNDVCKYF